MIDHLEAERIVNLKRVAVAVPLPKLAHSPPLSLSPLGPKWMQKGKNVGAQRDLAREIENDFLDSKETEISIGEDGSEHGDRIRARDAAGKTTILHVNFDTMTPKRCSDRRLQNWVPESAPVSPRIGCLRGLSLFPVRRSLVGSFEESLLSGRYSCGKDKQVRSVSFTTFLLTEFFSWTPHTFFWYLFCFFLKCRILMVFWLS